MKTFSITLPPKRVVIPRMGKDYTVPARLLVITQDDHGVWSCVAPPDDMPVPMSESDAITTCRSCDNWPELRSNHFPSEEL